VQEFQDIRPGYGWAQILSGPMPFDHISDFQRDSTKKSRGQEPSSAIKRGAIATEQQLTDAPTEQAGIGAG
jgi:hypothetical protein